MTSDNRAAIHEISGLDAVEECYRRGWTDGLPVAPPTVEKVAAMLEYVGLEPDRTLGEVPVRRRTLTAEQAAANAVMAGCLPEHFPVVLATMRAMFEYDPNCIHEASAATNSPGIMVLVNGPVRRQIGLNCGGNLFSPGNRANATIGRAIRLILINVFEQRPNVLDRGCMGALTKYGVCFGEDEENSPWEPFHVSRGFEADVSTVTVATIQDPEMLGNRYGTSAESVMDATADAMASHGLGIYLERRSLVLDRRPLARRDAGPSRLGPDPHPAIRLGASLAQPSQDEAPRGGQRSRYPGGRVHPSNGGSPPGRHSNRESRRR